MNEEIDFLAIGDVVTDAFIRINDAKIINDPADATVPLLSFRYGDKVPYEFVEEVRAVGNCANAAVSAARLGLKSALLAHVGNDHNGELCLQTLKNNHVNTTYIGVHEGMPTNYHYVLWHDVDRTILVKHQVYPLAMPQMPAPKMMYLTSLGEHTEPYHQEILAYIKANPEMKVVFQPGTFQMKMDTALFHGICASTYAFFCNLEEAELITGQHTRDVKVLMRALHDLGPKTVFLTDGMNGAYASDGTEQWFMPVYPHDPYERTGAGDAFASTVCAALLMGKNLQEALQWGPINSMSVVQFVGAQKGLLDLPALEKYLADAPTGYKPTIMM